jgi:Leucine-rich repeat (LRR) protein
MTPQKLSTSLPIQILQRPFEGDGKDWTVAGMGPEDFSLADDQFIGLRVRNIDDDFLRELVAEFRELTNLVMLNLSENRKVTDKGMRIIQPFTHLEELNVSSCDLSNKGLEFIAEFSLLRNLNISYCNRVTGGGLLVLRKLAHLEFLDLQGVPKINTGNIARIRKPTLTIHRP